MQKHRDHFGVPQCRFEHCGERAGQDGGGIEDLSKVPALEGGSEVCLTVGISATCRCCVMNLSYGG
jgi:hypothetical protein